CSSLPKILRIVAYCTRFGKKLKALRDNSPLDHPSGPISACEMENSLLQLIHLDQQHHFHEFISHLKKANQIPFKWRFLLSLNPFLDDSDTLRVGGRIQRSQEDFDVKHPILLPKSKLTVMIARREHVKQLHAPPTLLLATLRQKYWPLSGRNITRKVYHECYTCFRAKPIPTEQIMGDLPSSRVNFTRPFHSTARAQEFAHRWRLHYLNTLQQRSKWRVTKENLAPDQVVLLLDETNREGSKWTLGKIESTHPGADGYVRVVTVRTAKGVYKRPVTKIACLPTTDGDPAPATREQPGE
uniref:Uncharacterized protein n=1 Tax=Phlebotomus papatasi TaxID=29031 RepID=A0A1B0DIK0_PHLPP